MLQERKTNLKPFDITHKDRAWCALRNALELSAAVKELLADDGRLMGLITKADSLALYKAVAETVERANSFEEYLKLIKSLQAEEEAEEVGTE